MPFFAPMMAGKAQSQADIAQAQAAESANALNEANLASQKEQSIGEVEAAAGAAGVDANVGSLQTDKMTTAASYAREMYADNFQTTNTVNALYASAHNAMTQGVEGTLGNISSMAFGALTSGAFSGGGGGSGSGLSTAYNSVADSIWNVINPGSDFGTVGSSAFGGLFNSAPSTLESPALFGGA